MYQIIPPTPSKDDAFFWEAAQRHKLVARRCNSCETLQHPPEPMCWKCQSTDFAEEELSGNGTLHSWIVSKHPTQPDVAPRVVALVDLEEGIRIVSNVLVGTHDVNVIRNGRRVVLQFRDFGDVTLPQFALVDEENVNHG